MNGFKAKNKVLIGCLLLLTVQTSFAEDLTFTTDESSVSEDPKFKFYAPAPGEAPQPIDPNSAQDQSQQDDSGGVLFVGAPGYPKWDLFLSYNPQTAAFKQTLKGTTFSPNFSAASTNAYSVGARFNADLAFFMEGEYSVYTVKTDQLTGATLSVQESSVDVASTMFRGAYCFIGATSQMRNCGGLVLGQDSTPSLEFVGTSSLTLARIQDYVFGPVYYFEYRVSPFIGFHTRLSYEHGLKIGQNSNLGVEKHWKLAANIGLNGEITPRHGWFVYADFFQRQAEIEGIRGLNKESWTVDSSNLGARIGYIFSM